MQQYGSGKALRVMIRFYEKQCPSVIRQNKKYSLKQIIPITYTLKKRFVAAATFAGL